MKVESINKFFDNLKEGFRLLFDKEVPFIYKFIPLLGVLYLIYPFDFISDIIPVIGEVDDFAVIGGLFILFIKLAKKYKIKPKSNIKR